MKSASSKKFIRSMAKASVRRLKNGIVVNSPDGVISFISMSYPGSMYIEPAHQSTEQSKKEWTLYYSNTRGRVSMGTGSLDEMEIIKEVVGEAIGSDHHIAVALAYGLIGLMVGIGISYFAMVSSNWENRNTHHPEPTLTSSISPTMPPTPFTSPAIPNSVATRNTEPQTSSVDAMISKIAETDKVKAQNIVKTLNLISEFVKRSEPVPEELIEQLPTDITMKLVTEATSLGFPMPTVRRRGEGAPVVAPVVAQPPAAPTPNQTPRQSSPVIAPQVTPPVTTSGSPLTWGDTSPRDRNGILMLPEKDSSISRSGPVQLPGLGGGTLSTPEDLKSFGLPPQ